MDKHANLELHEVVPGKPGTTSYKVDLKIYEAADSQEVPFWLPDACFAGNCLRPGYHSFIMTCSVVHYHDFEIWVDKHGSIMKIIGCTPNPF